MMKHLVLALAFLLLCSSPLWAIDRLVPFAYPTIQAAVNAADPGDAVVIAPGVYSDVTHQPPGDTTRCVVIMKSGITLRGGGMNNTIIDVNAHGNVFGRGIYCSGVTNATIENLTVKRAFAGTFGCGIFCRDGSTVTIRNCEITACRDGGIISIDASPTITGCWITNNVAKQGGGLSLEVGQLGTGSSSHVTGCVIRGNSAPSGGGVFINGFPSEPVLDHCIIDNNFINLLTGNGGGMTITGARVALTNSWINNNVSNGTGGGINMEDCRVSITNCRIQGNSNTVATGPGGGIFAGYNTDLTMQHCTVVRNMASGTDLFTGGGGICINGALSAVIRQCTIARNGAPSGEGGGLVSYGVNATIDKCIVALNDPGPGMFCADGAMPVVSCTDLFGNQGGNTICGVNAGSNFSLDPRFCNSAADDYRLQSNSPCLPGGHPGACNADRIGGEDQGCASVDVEETQAPTPIFVQGNDPNPFVGRTTIRFDLTKAGVINLSIYDVGGRTIRTLRSGRVEAGSHQLVWDGKNEQGDQVPSGIYFYSLKGEGSSETRRMVLAR